jgi:hypothetical protein
MLLLPAIDLVLELNHFTEIHTFNDYVLQLSNLVCFLQPVEILLTIQSISHIHRVSVHRHYSLCKLTACFKTNFEQVQQLKCSLTGIPDKHTLMETTLIQAAFHFI